MILIQQSSTQSSRNGMPPLTLDLQGKTIVVTGAASGIGAAAARLCSNAGARLALLDLHPESIADVADKCKEGGAEAVTGITCDVGLEDSIAAAFEVIEDAIGLPDGLFAAAGIDIGGEIHSLEAATWRRVLRTNLDGSFLASKYTIAAMLRSGRGGSVVLASSPAAFVAFAAGGSGPYAASKGGVSALVRAMAIDYASAGIRVNAIVPGPTETPLMWANVAEDDIPSMRAQVEREVPIGRLAGPEEPARAALWLLSEHASYVTGSHLVCDGGLLAKAAISI
jgi:NAD(P)-dependent dehydrogenase (short-subunit alcohol dehydrogenase family)